MSTPTLHPAIRSRWMDWKPKARILADSAKGEPTKPSKRSFVGFGGATSAECPEIEAGLDPAELARASAVLNRAAVRIVRIEGGVTRIGVWSDIDSAEIRKALQTVGAGQVRVRYLDGADIPLRYKVRRAASEPVPMNVLTEMERHPDKPWTVRDELLREMGWRPNHSLSVTEGGRRRLSAAPQTGRDHAGIAIK